MINNNLSQTVKMFLKLDMHYSRAYYRHGLEFELRTPYFSTFKMYELPSLDFTTKLLDKKKAIYTFLKR